MEVMKLKRVLKEKKGNAILLACVIVIALILIFTGIMEYIRLQMIAQGVRDALQTSIISVATQNYDEVYNGLREGYSGGYYLSGTDHWESKLDIGDVYGNLDELLGLHEDEEYHYKAAKDGYEFRLSDLKVNVVNVPLAPSDINHVSKFKAEAFISIEVPLSFGFNQLPPLRIRLKVTAGYTPKF